MKNDSGCSIDANYFRGAGAVGGKIIFDETGFAFKSNAFNIQTGEIKINYSQINAIQTRNTLGIVPNGIPVFTKYNFEHKFVIFNRKSVIDYLSKQIIT